MDNLSTFPLVPAVDAQYPQLWVRTPFQRPFASNVRSHSKRNAGSYELWAPR